MENSDLSKLRIEADKRGSASGSRPKKRRLWLLVAVVLGVVAFVYLARMGFLIPAAEVQTVKVALIYPSRALTILNASGYVVAQRKAAVSSKATGRLEKLNVEEGKQVREGDILAVLENQDLKATLEEAQAAQKVAQAALRNAEAELTDATLNYQRNTALRQSGAVSVQAFDAAEARYKKAVASERSARFGVDRAEASLKVAEVNLEYSYIRAPFPGVILTKNADVGEVVAPFGASSLAKAAVVTMADMDSLMVEVDVAESSLEKVKVGGAAEIRLDAYPHDRFPGTVHMIVPTADRSKATVMTKVKFDKLDPKVLPEMSAKVAFLSRPLKEDEHTPFLGVPAAAIKAREKTKVVFRVASDRMQSIPVKTGRTWNDVVEILDGLSEGDLVILSSDKPLQDGRRIRVKE
ncbi:efflux RND transporter periplasmic adaptor subunit [Desulfomonile tiedjei]|uniref:RND family efflux transporter, MFP subunit n=1 Tax=Desulfomonile tiedjei (strain ATCC 49306 / DSM 6799 / DCB-1) TaxID=706587 RepID=I4C755_DESTA|nr:efflux RND transporter periplasmic adaptor subunit [Desulfomonile tiedjei]AFM25396.1 RND family efflux transporter, MFP subunit [Desulfomonile tiedjei DSM 6799]